MIEKKSCSSVLLHFEYYKERAKAHLTLVFSVLTMLYNSSSVKEFLLLHIFIACVAINSFLPSILTICPCCLVRLFRRINHIIEKYHVIVLWFKHLRGTRFLWPVFAVVFCYTRFHVNLLSSCFLWKKKSSCPAFAWWIVEIIVSFLFLKVFLTGGRTHQISAIFCLLKPTLLPAS